MTRKEEIRQEAHRKYPYEGGIKGLICENSIPIFIKGAEWADKTMIEKACEWMKGQVYQEYGGGPLERLIPDTRIEEFRKVMEE